jgi:hypothetical protein
MNSLPLRGLLFLETLALEAIPRLLSGASTAGPDFAYSASCQDIPCHLIYSLANYVCSHFVNHRPWRQTLNIAAAGSQRDGWLCAHECAGVIQKCADGLYRALRFTSTGNATLNDNPNADGSGVTLRKGLTVDGRGLMFAPAHARLTPHIAGPANPGPLGRLAKTEIANPLVESDLNPDATTAIAKMHRGECYMVRGN